MFDTWDLGGFSWCSECEKVKKFNHDNLSRLCLTLTIELVLCEIYLPFLFLSLFTLTHLSDILVEDLIPFELLLLSNQQEKFSFDCTMSFTYTCQWIELWRWRKTFIGYQLYISLFALHTYVILTLYMISVLLLSISFHAHRIKT